MKWLRPVQIQVELSVFLKPGCAEVAQSPSILYHRIMSLKGQPRSTFYVLRTVQSSQTVPLHQRSLTWACSLFALQPPAVYLSWIYKELLQFDISQSPFPFLKKSSFLYLSYTRLFWTLNEKNICKTSSIKYNGLEEYYLAWNTIGQKCFIGLLLLVQEKNSSD